jgi:hypothetical protein
LKGLLLLEENTGKKSKILESNNVIAEKKTQERF